jgi:hypothetical protein
VVIVDEFEPQPIEIRERSEKDGNKKSARAGHGDSVGPVDEIDLGGLFLEEDNFGAVGWGDGKRLELRYFFSSYAGK